MIKRTFDRRLNFYLFPDPNWPRAECNTLAEALVSSCDGTAVTKPNIIPMNSVESQRREVVRTTTRRPGS